MEYYKYAAIATGTIAFMYVMLKVFSHFSDKASKDKQLKEESDERMEKAGTIDSIDTSKVMKLPKLKPNCFVGFQINNVEIHKKIKKLQERFVLKTPSLFSTVINVSSLHITLAVTHLANDEDIEIVKRKLDEWAAENLETYFKEPCVLTFRGVKTFNNVVAYVDIEQCDNYKRLCDLSKDINNVISSAGYTTDKRSYTPHLTILKLSKDYKLLKFKRNFRDDFESLKECTDYFGKQEIHSLQLLSMDEPRDKFGYYKCYHEIKVSDSDANMDHHECCRPIAKPRCSFK